MKDKQTFEIVIDADNSDELKPVDQYVKDTSQRDGHEIAYSNEASLYDMEITLVNVQTKKRSIKIEIT